MNIRPLILFISFFASGFCCEGQRGNIWCFGDSAGLDFNSGNPIPFASRISSIESSASISDNNGNLLFYIGDTATNSFGCAIKNKIHKTIIGGSDMNGYGSCTNGFLIIPFPVDTNKHYLFTKSKANFQPPSHSLYYSIVDMTLDSGRGDVVVKDTLLNVTPITERICAVKHANGRDWWIITHAFPGNQFIIYLISQFGISTAYLQTIGTSFNSSNGLIGEIASTSKGDRLALVSNDLQIIDIYQFDRCTGILSNFQTITASSSFDAFYGCEFSPEGSRLYVTTELYSFPYSSLLQFDLSSPNISASRILIYNTNNDSIVIGQLQLAPDNKIYAATYFASTDTIFNSFNMNLSVINNPDLLDTTCDFVPYCVSLGGKRSFLGLPNMPNYNLGVLVGSPCDTLTVGISSHDVTENNFTINYNPVSQTAFINVQNLKGKNYALNIYDLMGNLLFKEEGYASTSPSMTSGRYFTKDFNMQSLASGVYVVSLVTDREVLNGKFVRE